MPRQVLYIYDIKAKDKRIFNRTKRRFYYHLNKLELKRECWRTKSALAVPVKLEGQLDAFFRMFGNKVEVYKTRIRAMEELE